MSGTSDFVSIRGLRYHVRRWGRPGAPRLFMAHGWLDVSATFDAVASRLAERYEVLIADWRGFGLTEWPQDGYWFPDYVADLDALVDHYAGSETILLAGHSMGAQVCSLYAGLRPARVRRLAILDGLFLPDMPVSSTPQRYERWLDRLKGPSGVPVYDSYEVLAGRVRRRHPKLDPAHCLEIARAWGGPEADGRIRLRCDPKHLIDNPRPYRQDESDAIWAQVACPTLFVDGGASPFRAGLPPQEMARRRALFRDHRVAQIADAGHMLHFEAPAELARLLGEFFGEVAA